MWHRVYWLWLSLVLSADATGLSALKASDVSLACRSTPCLATEQPPNYPLMTVNRAPTLAPINDYMMTEGEVLEIDVAAHDLDEDDLSFAVGDLPAGARFTDHGDGTATFRWIPGHDQAGNFPVTVIVTDAGVPIASDTTVLTITVGEINRPPQLHPIGNQQVAVGETLHFPITTTDPDGDPRVVTGADLPAGAALIDYGDGTATFTWTPGVETVGNVPVTIIVTDTGIPMESDAAVITLTVGEVNRPPQLHPIGNRQVATGDVLHFPITTTDPDGDPRVITGADLPAGAELIDHGDGTATFTWTPGVEAVGNVPVTIIVTDTGVPMASDTVVVTITVGEVNRPPRLTPIGNRQVAVGAALHFPITTTDPDGDPRVITGADLPAGAELIDHGDGTATFTWTPGVDAVGSFPVTIIVTDDGVPRESTSHTITLHVGETSRPLYSDTSDMTGMRTAGHEGRGAGDGLIGTDPYGWTDELVGPGDRPISWGDPMPSDGPRPPGDSVYVPPGNIVVPVFDGWEQDPDASEDPPKGPGNILVPPEDIPTFPPFFALACGVREYGNNAGSSAHIVYPHTVAYRSHRTTARQLRNPAMAAVGVSLVNGFFHLTQPQLPFKALGLSVAHELHYSGNLTVTNRGMFGQGFDGGIYFSRIVPTGQVPGEDGFVSESPFGSERRNLRLYDGKGNIITFAPKRTRVVRTRHYGAVVKYLQTEYEAQTAGYYGHLVRNVLMPGEPHVFAHHPNVNPIIHRMFYLERQREMSTTDGEVRMYLCDGSLGAIQDRHGNEMLFTYGGKVNATTFTQLLTGWTSTNGDRFTVEYTRGQQSGVLTNINGLTVKGPHYEWAVQKITGPTGLEVTYDYRDHHLVAVRRAFGPSAPTKTTAYGYQGDFLNRVTGPGRSKPWVRLDLDAHGQVKQESLGGGELSAPGVYEFFYPTADSRTVRDPNGTTHDFQLSDGRVSTHTLQGKAGQEQRTHTTSYTYNAHGEIKTKTTPTHQTIFTWDESSEPLPILGGGGYEESEGEYTAASDLTAGLLLSVREKSLDASSPGETEVSFFYELLSNQPAGHRDANLNTLTIAYTQFWPNSTDKNDLADLGEPRTVFLPDRTQPDGSKVTSQRHYTYWPGGTIKTKADDNGLVTSYVYDERGNVTEVEHPAGSQSFKYNDRGYVIEETTRGSTTQFVRDEIDRITHIIKDVGGFNTLVEAIEHDLENNLVSVTAYRHDTFDSSLNAPPSQADTWITTTTRFTLLGQPEIRTVTDSSGKKETTKIRYDGKSYPTEIERPSATGASVKDRITYNCFDAVDTVTTAFGTQDEQTMTYRYDREGRLEKRLDPHGGVHRWVYDHRSLNDWVRERFYPNGRHDVFERDGNGNVVSHRVLSQTDTLLSRTDYVFNEMDQVIKEIQHALRTYDPQSGITAATETHEWHRYYTKDNRMHKEVGPSGAPKTLVYDPATGRLQRVTDEVRNITEMQYDANGYIGSLKKTLRTANGQTDELHETHTYNALGQLIAIFDSEGHATQFFYNNRDELRSTVLPNNVWETIAYHPDGSIAGRETPHGKTTYAYVAGHPRVVKYQNDTVIHTYDYTPGGLLKRLVVTRGSDTVHHDFEHDLSQRTGTVTDPRGVKVTTLYDSMGLPQDQTITYPDLATSLFNGRETCKHAVGPTTRHFEYNELGRLIRATTGGYNDNSAPGTSMSREYDGLGRQILETQQLFGTAPEGPHTMAISHESDTSTLYYPQVLAAALGVPRYHVKTWYDGLERPRAKEFQLEANLYLYAGYGFYGTLTTPMSRKLEWLGREFSSLTLFKDERPASHWVFKDGSEISRDILEYNEHRIEGQLRWSTLTGAESTRHTFGPDNNLRQTVSKYRANGNRMRHATLHGYRQGRPESIVEHVFDESSAQTLSLQATKLAYPDHGPEVSKADIFFVEEPGTDYAGWNVNRLRREAVTKRTHHVIKGHQYDANGNLIGDDGYCYGYDDANRLTRVFYKYPSGRWVHLRATYGRDFSGRVVWRDYSPEQTAERDRLASLYFLYDGDRLLGEVQHGLRGRGVRGVYVHGPEGQLVLAKRRQNDNLQEPLVGFLVHHGASGQLAFVTNEHSEEASVESRPFGPGRVRRAIAGTDTSLPYDGVGWREPWGQYMLVDGERTVYDYRASRKLDALFRQDAIREGVRTAQLQGLKSLFYNLAAPFVLAQPHILAANLASTGMIAQGGIAAAAITAGGTVTANAGLARAFDREYSGQEALVDLGLGFLGVRLNLPVVANMALGATADALILGRDADEVALGLVGSGAAHRLTADTSGSRRGLGSRSQRGCRVGNCFVAGTQVKTDEGLQPIETIEVGALVWARDDATGEETWKPVIDTIERTSADVLELELRGENGEPTTLRVTGEHPLWTPPGVWVEASRLQPGDQVYAAAAGWVTVQSTQAVPGPHRVYNLEVADYHTYFVGAAGVWAHNCGVEGRALGSEEDLRGTRNVTAFVDGAGKRHNALMWVMRDLVDQGQQRLTLVGDLRLVSGGKPRGHPTNCTERGGLCVMMPELERMVKEYGTARHLIVIAGHYPPCPGCHREMTGIANKFRIPIVYLVDKEVGIKLQEERLLRAQTGESKQWHRERMAEILRANDGVYLPGTGWVPGPPRDFGLTYDTGFRGLQWTSTIQ